MVYWKYPGLCTFFFKTSTWYLLFMLYYAVIYTFRDSLDFFPMLMPKPCSGDFKAYINNCLSCTDMLVYVFKIVYCMIL